MSGVHDGAVCTHPSFAEEIKEKITDAEWLVKGSRTERQNVKQNYVKNPLKGKD